ncbi:MAG TPA: UvrB/UvrC motif-containing protein [Candidatus Treponema faecavium]|nr:UvrB/UvrC motif-containing protein [Candidatus Treponema faecavium]
MKCDICGIREAVIFIQQVSASKRTDVHLCVECAKARGINGNTGKLERSFAGLLSEIANLRQMEAHNSRLCPVCGQSLGQIQKTGMTGCPECYSIFTAEIQSFLQQEGISGVYAGTLPKRLAHFRSALTDRIWLRTKLEESVANEDYEKAALYRDRLKALEKCAVADGSAESYSAENERGGCGEQSS